MIHGSFTKVTLFKHKIPHISFVRYICLFYKNIRNLKIKTTTLKTRHNKNIKNDNKIFRPMKIFFSTGPHPKSQTLIQGIFSN